MRIIPINFNFDRTKFTSNSNDLGKMILDGLNEKLSNGYPSEDEFVPSTPTKPIIIENLEIKTGEGKSNTASALTGSGIGTIGGTEISKKLGSRKQSDSTHQPDDEQKVDYNKISEEAAQETNGRHSDTDNDFEINETDDNLENNEIDDDCDFDDGEE